MSLFAWTNKIGNDLLDLLYPPGLYCICCGKITDGTRTYSMCNDCISSIRWVNGRSCTVCGRAMNDNNPKEVCFECSKQTHLFDKGYVCSEYGVHEKTILYELKYASEGYIGDVLGEVVYDKMSAELGEDVLAAAYDIVVPVPIYKVRKQQRGFNQAELIAKAFAKRAGLDADSEILVRTRATSAMKGLNPSERKQNIKDAFDIRPRKLPKLQEARILLIDDIYTTGATIDEAASVLKSAGAARVDFAVFAAGADIIYA